MTFDVELYKRIASLEAMGVPSAQIAEVVGKNSAADIGAIKGTQEYKELLAEEYTRHAERNKSLNDGWDEIEKRSLTIVKKTLEYSSNPDFALRAAMVANRATRRGGNGNTPLPAHLGDRAVINLSQVFIGKLEKNEVALPQPTPMKTIDGEVVKRENLMSPGQVEVLMQQETPPQDMSFSLDDLL